jgi:shikimate kinase
MINIHFSDNTHINLDIEKCKTYIDLKKEIYLNKFKSTLINTSDLILITYGKIINDDESLDYIKNQVFLVKINVDIEINKFLNDERFLKLVSNDKTRKLLYHILENPDLLEKLKKFRFQKELDEINSMKLNVLDEQIKELLEKHSGNIEIVVNSILNL